MSAGLSPPFAHREFNGETLLEELKALRQSAVAQRQLDDCALAVRALKGATPAELPSRFKQLAQSRFGAQPELSGLLVRWAAKVRTPADVGALCSHFERLALTSSLISSLYRGAGRLPKGEG